VWPATVSLHRRILVAGGGASIRPPGADPLVVRGCSSHCWRRPGEPTARSHRAPRLGSRSSSSSVRATSSAEHKTRASCLTAPNAFAKGREVARVQAANHRRRRATHRTNLRQRRDCRRRGRLDERIEVGSGIAATRSAVCAAAPIARRPLQLAFASVKAGRHRPALSARPLPAATAPVTRLRAQ
jgi:hypothetical protein